MGDPIVGGVLGLAGTMLGGEDPSVSYGDPSKRIMPETDYEANLRQKLTDIALNNITKAPGLIDAATQRQIDLMSGKIPDTFGQAFQKAIYEDVGNTLGTQIRNLGQRGVLNSSVMSDAVTGIGKDINTQSAKNYQTNLALLGNLNAGASNMAQQLMAQPTNLYNMWRTSRFGVQGTPITDPGSAPPFAGLGSELLKNSFTKMFGGGNIYDATKGGTL